jgi:antitoxin MazE
MLVSVIQIGNSRGIRLPKKILEQCDIQDKIELEVIDKEIIIKAIKNNPREGWGEKFRLMADNGEDKLLIDDTIGLDMKNWEW